MFESIWEERRNPESGVKSKGTESFKGGYIWC